MKQNWNKESLLAAYPRFEAQPDFYLERMADAEKGFAFFQKYLREKGIIAALEEKGIKEGDTVRIYDLEFTYYK